MCFILAQCASIFASVKQRNQLNHNTMNTEITMARISEMISSESSYQVIVDMIQDMELELMDISLA